MKNFPSLALIAAPLLAFSSLLIATLLVLPAFSSAADDKKPARKKRPAPIPSPIVEEDDRLTFRIAAPKAKDVSLSGEMLPGKLAMKRDDEGLWSVTIDPVPPGLYGYSFTIDGLKMIDPGNRHIKPGRSPRTSILHVAGGNSFDFEKIPHGTVHEHVYFSQPIDRIRDLRVYTPPGYETGNEHYPLLVLQHGHSDSYAAWTTYGKAHLILDNLIAADKCVPMIVLMLDGHPVPESWGDGRSEANTGELRRDLIEVVLPFVEKRYRLRPGRKNRAITGLSMGGLHSLTIGLNELDTFSQVGAFSAAVPTEEEVKSALENGVKTNKQLDLLWIACGKEDFLLGENHKFVAALEKSGIEHQFLLTEGKHSWPVWRQYLADFAPLLFRE